MLQSWDAFITSIRKTRSSEKPWGMRTFCLETTRESVMPCKCSSHQGKPGAHNTILDQDTVVLVTSRLRMADFWSNMLKGNQRKTVLGDWNIEVPQCSKVEIHFLHRSGRLGVRGTHEECAQILEMTLESDKPCNICNETEVHTTQFSKIKMHLCRSL